MSGRTPTTSSARLCYVVDDEPAICRMISVALRAFGVETEYFHDVPSMIAGLERRDPDLMLLDVSLGETDAIDAIRSLSRARMTGTVYLMSGRAAALLEDVRLVGERHGLRMGRPLAKPFRIDALKQIVESERLRVETPERPMATSEVAASPPSIDLGDALDRDWVDLWYQPKLDLHGRQLVGAEGLARVRHPEHGVMVPGSFIPDAAKEDLVKLAEYALRVAMRDSAEFAIAGFNLRLAVNVPVDALITLPIASIVRECRKGEKSEWRGIVLEVTEDQIIRDIPLAHEIATQLRIQGIDLAIDDFGSGYSSIARLKDLPFVELKLDRSFVNDCASDATKAELCKLVVELAHRFSSLAVAEGIETSSDLATIQSIGCDLAQGYLFARPMPKDVLLARLKAGGAADFDARIAANGAARSALA